MSDTLNLTLAQLNPTLGDLDKNAKTILDVWKKHDGSSDLVIFPELFLCGYPPEDLVMNSVFQELSDEKVAEICRASSSFKSAALVPSIVFDQERRVCFNAAILIEKGEIVDVFMKHKLPNYAVFDEVRTFEPAPLPDPFVFRGHKIGLMICEDAWHTDVPLHLKDKGAEILISINGSPYSYRQHQDRHVIATQCVEETGLDLIYLNMTGGQDELVFDGSSFVMNKDGKTIYQASAFKDEIIQINATHSASSYNFEIQNKNTEKQDTDTVLYEALKVGVRDYLHKNGFKKALIGLSGGIDSALTASICVDALGADNVRCIMMPSEFTSHHSLEDAKECAALLGVKYEVIAIKDAVKTFEGLIPDLSGLAHENTQSRIRGVILMALSNMTGEMVITTGNKSEMAVGYCTLYGDMNGGYNPLKDLYKTDVYRISEWRNKQNPAIPERIITKEPSAELRADQKDQDSLPPYEILDDILKLLVEYDDIDWSEAPEDIQEILDRCGNDLDLIHKVAKLLKISEYKRYQAPPGTRISFKAFGRDRRYPMTNNFVNSIAKKH